MINHFWLLLNLNPNFFFFNQKRIFLNKNECVNIFLFDSSKRAFTNINIDIKNCIFERSFIYSGGNGGVIYCSGTSINMEIKDTIFFNCICTKNCGAIYFIGLNSNFERVCGNKCSTGIGYAWQFGFSETQNSILCNNSYNFFSLINCANSTIGLHSFVLDYGNIIVKNFNSSKNSCIRTSGIYIYYPNKFTSSFCTIVDNKVSESICIVFDGNGNNNNFTFSNIINNNSPSRGIILVQRSGNYEINSCIFKKNEGTLFLVESATLNSKNNKINFSLIINSGNIINLNNILIETITYQLEHFNSFICLIYNENLKFSQKSKNVKYNFYFLIFLFK